MKIISESAFNHNGDKEYLKKLALESKNCGADYFTLQVMDPDSFCKPSYSKYDIYKKNSFTRPEWVEIFDYCKDIGINVIPCVLEEDSFELCYEYGYRYFKVHATDIINVPFLKKIKQRGNCRLMLETQCATYQDILVSLEVISDMVDTIVHGYSNYPTELEDLNLNVIHHLKKDFPQYKYGLADHSPTVTEVPLMALAIGYDFLEKHITLTRNNRNFDWQVSIYPEEFKVMVSTLQLYHKALGNGIKHPVKNELVYRDIMYKKVLNDNDEKLYRQDNCVDYLTHEFKSYRKDRVGIALIARLKSQRLKEKVLLSFHENSIIEDLFTKLAECKYITKLKLTTSDLLEDQPLCSRFEESDCLQGHAISVIDRIFSFVRENKLGAVLRVTGDNPFTDNALIEMMVEMYQNNELDYIRVNNVPFGVSAELFSTKYLWDLYLKMENPHNSEYLSWDVLNDENARKGCLNFIPKDSRVSYVNLSIDYKEDYDRALDLLRKIGKDKVVDIKLGDIIKNIDLADIIDENKKVKLPDNQYILFKDYLRLMNNVEYKVKKNIHEADIYNW